ncbi:MAG: hypothetical protein PHW95_02680 [Patescibacteria group bacterium]|nr:hypothetical protein [Patescibacteria group bacterium]
MKYDTSFLKILVIVFTILVISGCQRVTQQLTNTADLVSGKVQAEQKKQADKTAATINCQDLCQTTLSNDGVDLSVGPCLSEKILSDWVCDIAHSPRQPIDNDPRNQCADFRTGSAHHFVELDGNCNIIQAN